MPRSTAKAATVSKATNPRVKARQEYAKVPTKAVADDPGRYSKTPHEYGDLLITPNAKGQTKLGGALQRDLVYWIERHTWGKNTGTPAKVIRPEWAKLSLTALAKLCGSDRRTVARAIADLVKRSIIEARDRTGCGATVAKMYKLTPELWKKAPYYEPPTAAEIAAELVEEEEAAEAAPESEASADAESTVAPGKASRPQPVALSIGKDAPAVSIRVVYRSVDLPFPVRFSSRPGRNGRLQINCRAVAPQSFANHSPVETPVSVADKRFNDYSEWISAFVLNFWGKAADSLLISSIVSASGNAPLATFERIVLFKFRNTRTRPEKHSPGLLIELGKDAARAHRAETWRAAADAARSKAPTAPADPELVETPEEAPAAPLGDPCGKCKGKGTKEVWSNRNGTYAARPVPCAACQGTGRKAAQ